MSVAIGLFDNTAFTLHKRFTIAIADSEVAFFEEIVPIDRKPYWGDLH